MDGLYTIVEFDTDNKWFVIAEKVIEGIKYSYLIRVNSNEDDFLDEYMVVKSSFEGEREFMEIVNEKDELQRVMPILVPDSKEYIDNPEKLRELLRMSE